MTTHDDYKLVFSAFVEYRKAIKKSIPTLTEAKSNKIKKALSKIPVHDLILMFEYFTKSKDEYVSFINGENEHNRFYGTLDNLFRVTKLLEKINRAKAWQKQQIKNEQNKSYELFIPFIVVEKQDIQQHFLDQLGDDIDYEDEKEENQIGRSNFQMTIFNKNKDTK